MKIKNKNQFFEQLQAITPVDLMNRETTKDEASKLCLQVMEVFASYNGKQSDFSSDDNEKMKETLKSLGLISIDEYNRLLERHEDYSPNGHYDMLSLLKISNELGGPLSVLGNCYNDFDHAINNMEDWRQNILGKNSISDTWVKSWDKKEKKRVLETEIVHKPEDNEENFEDSVFENDSLHTVREEKTSFISSDNISNRAKVTEIEYVNDYTGRREKMPFISNQNIRNKDRANNYLERFKREEMLRNAKTNLLYNGFSDEEMEIEKPTLTPYRLVAKKALMSWNGLSEEEADNVVKNSSFEELENQCWASGSMQYAIDYLANRLNLTDEEKTDFANAVFGKDKVYLDGFDKETLKDIGKKLETTNRHQVVVETLSAIHDGWVKDNAKKFNQVLRDDKRYQHLPIELIGWEEASLDMLFLQPILESTEIKFSKKETIQAYNQSIKNFFEKNDLQSTDDLAKLIEKGPDFYSPLTEKNSVKDTFMFNEKTMDYLKRHKGDKRIKNLSYPDITEKDKFVEEVQSIVNQLHEEDCEMAAKQAVLNGNDPRSVNEYMQTLKPLKVETVDVTKEELAEVVAEQAVEKLPINENIKEDLFGGDEE